jgi:hypothetical protein
MASKRDMRMPKEGLVEPEAAGPDGFIDQDDVEGHGLPLTPPPSFGSQRTPGHGGENIPTPVEDDDVEGHIR